MTDTNIEVVATVATEESAKKSPAKKTTTTKKTTTAKAEGTTTAKKTTTKKATTEGEAPAKKTTTKKATTAKKVEAVEEVVATEAEVVAPVKKAPAKKKAVKAKAPLYINGRYVAEKTFAAKPAKGHHPYELTNNMIKITLVKSLHGRLDKQQRTLVALGLTKINHSVVKADNKAIRGMIFVVKHLVTVEEVK